VFKDFGFDLSWYANVNLMYNRMITCKVTCYGSKIGTLDEFFPRHTAGSFTLSIMNVESLQGMPETVGLDCDVSDQNLQSLEGCAREVGGEFNCSKNRMLKSLVGGPALVGGRYDASNCDLQDLVGGPEYVGESFVASYNRELKSLKGGPKAVGGDYRLTGCKSVESMKGVAEFIYGCLVAPHVVAEARDMPKIIHGAAVSVDAKSNLPVNRLWGAVTQCSTLEALAPISDFSGAIKVK
jgi:hypothetical protein